jgi:glutamyl-tRNA synthetase
LSDSATPAVRTRFPPSPTGFLHVGNVRTAIFNWLLARHHGGRFLLRIEDTDRARLVEGAIESMMDTLRWLGLDWDEGPDVGGPCGPYVQSERLPIYREHAARLLEEGKAYRCYCSAERLDALRKEQQREGRPTGYDRLCRNLSPEKRAAREASGDPHVVRFAIPLEGETVLEDLLRGPIVYQNAGLDDFVILKTDGYPPYHFAVVVDDHLMRVSHVMRGEEYISSGARDSLLHEALGWEQPLYAHGAIVLAPDRKKLGKRHGAVAATEFREAGFVPEALFNYLALLGAAYSGDREVFSREELIELFDIPRMSAAPAIFDRAKLEWMNGHYINHVLTLPDVVARCMPYLREARLVADETPAAYVERVVALVKERMKLLTDVAALTDFFFVEPEPAAADLIPKKLSAQDTERALRAGRERLDALGSWEEPELERQLRALAEELEIKTGQLFTALRVAVTGRTVAPGLFETMAVLGRERTLLRLRRAEETLQAE